MRRPSRLWRALGLTQPLVNVWSEDDENLDLTDHNIKRITISRGSTSTSFGPQDHVIEIATTVPRGVRGGQRLHCDLSTYGAGVVSGLVNTTPPYIEQRYFGRVGRQTIDDTGGLDGTNWHTTFFGASWQAQLSVTDVELNEPAGKPVRDHLRQISAPMGVGLPWIPPSEAPAASEQYGGIATEGTPRAFSESMSRWGTDVGIYVQNCRDGHDRFLPIQYRWDQAVARSSVAAPLTRSQAISPATWDQPQENMARTHHVQWIGAAGADYMKTGDDPANPNKPEVDYDLRHVRWATNDFQPRHVAYVGFNQERNTGYNLPSVTIDLLRLVTSPLAYHRDQARQLLMMEMGDPIFLSNDWHPYLRGIHFTNGIDESFSRDGWEIKLSLTPSVATLGEWTPEITPRVWDSARYPWHDETRRWDDS